jgi:flagellar biosynthesis/type III secretory pathway M-ring protein FliF/YscJ
MLIGLLRSHVPCIAAGQMMFPWRCGVICFIYWSIRDHVICAVQSEMEEAGDREEAPQSKKKKKGDRLESEDGSEPGKKRKSKSIDGQSGEGGTKKGEKKKKKSIDG